MENYKLTEAERRTLKAHLSIKRLRSFEENVGGWLEPEICRAIRDAIELLELRYGKPKEAI